MIVRNVKLVFVANAMILFCGVVTSLLSAWALGPAGRGDLLVVTLWPPVCALAPAAIGNRGRGGSLAVGLQHDDVHRLILAAAKNEAGSLELPATSPRRHSCCSTANTLDAGAVQNAQPRNLIDKRQDLSTSNST